MKRILLIIVVLITIILARGMVSAQEIDIEALDKEEMLLLLQALTQRLQENETEPETEPDPTEVPAPSPTPEVKPVRSFKIYENKKLVVSRLPDSMFVRKEDLGGGGEDNEETSKSDEPSPKTCPRGTEWNCAFDVNGNFFCDCFNG